MHERNGKLCLFFKGVRLLPECAPGVAEMAKPGPVLDRNRLHDPNQGPGRRSRLWALILCALLAGHAVIACAQTVTGAAAGDTELPQAPSPESPALQSLGSLSGEVFDVNGGAVPAATITLLEGSLPQRTAVSDASGTFTFTGLPAGTIQFTVVSPGLETFVSKQIVLQAGERYLVPRIVLPVDPASTVVEVRVTQKEVAQEQMKEAEQQRVLGVIPNFYSSYIWNAAPLSPKQKFELAFRSKLDPVAFVSSGVTAGIEQRANRFPGYGQDAQSYAKRYGAAYATGALGRLIGSALLPSLLHQDPRYFYRGSGSIPSRTLYALSAALICRGDNGRPQPNYSNVLGDLAAGGISNLYHPAGDRGVTLTIDNALIAIAANAASNVVREFLLRGLTPRVPAYANGKP
jgi:Carboxypeptidase regulatory-like domain